MIIKTLELKDFRNYESLSLELDPGVNVFHGDNAQGKTNILESIYIASTGKSHRGAKDREIIRFEQDEAHIRMMLERRGALRRIDMHLRKSGHKGAAVDGVPIRKITELLGVCRLVFFSPEDLGIIKDSPAVRRRFMDMELCQLNRILIFPSFPIQVVVPISISATAKKSPRKGSCERLFKRWLLGYIMSLAAEMS